MSAVARRAAQARNWPQVRACAQEILHRQNDSAEGHFLLGLAEKAAHRSLQAIESFSAAIASDPGRYDAATELAEQHMHEHRYGDAADLLARHESLMQNSPRYLNMAATIYVNIGLPARGWPLYRRANELQPGVDSIQANLAACSVYVGKIDEAKAIYAGLLRKHPQHQRNHYELSRLGRATNAAHVDEMKAVLQQTQLPPAQNIYLYYAIGKELEDLERWNEAFEYYRMAGDAAASVANYDVQTDLRLIDKVIEVCTADWLAHGVAESMSDSSGVVPVFIVGLPRSGTTLTERILSSHAKVESAGESFFMQIMIKRESGIESDDSMNAAIIEAAGRADIHRIGAGYMQAIAYRLSDKYMFIEKFPENFLYLGFVAKAFPGARIVHLKRNPMDACFAMFKQSFFRYAYSLDDLGLYYAAYRRLHEHWRKVLGTRLIELDYEDLVSDQEEKTRWLLDQIGLEFDSACLNFEKNEAASNTASTVQIREKVHTRSVQRWKCFERQLQPLRSFLEGAGIPVE